MKKTLGILIIMIGAGMFSFTGFNKSTGNKVMTDNGMMKDAPEVKSKSVNWFPFAGAVLFVTGIVITTSKKSK